MNENEKDILLAFGRYTQITALYWLFNGEETYLPGAVSELMAAYREWRVYPLHDITEEQFNSYTVIAAMKIFYVLRAEAQDIVSGRKNNLSSDYIRETGDACMDIAGIMEEFQFAKIAAILRKLASQLAVKADDAHEEWKSAAITAVTEHNKRVSERDC